MGYLERTSDEKIQEIIRIYKETKNMSECCRRTGLCIHTVRKWLTRNGIEPARKKRVYDIDSMVADFNSGMSFEEMSKKYGIPKSTSYVICRDAGCKTGERCAKGVNRTIEKFIKGEQSGSVTVKCADRREYRYANIYAWTLIDRFCLWGVYDYDLDPQNLILTVKKVSA